jgi:hypothetical protein
MRLERENYMRMRTIPAVFVLVGMMSAGCHDAFAYQASLSQIVVSAPEHEGPIASPLIVEPIYPGATLPKPRGRVAGLVRDQQGRPIRLAQVWLRDAHPAKEASFTLDSGARGGPAGATSGLDGSFDIPSVPPGEYLLEVHAPGELGVGGFYPADTTPATNLIAVTEASVTHVIAELSSGASLEGTVRFDDGSTGIGMKIEVFAKGAHPLKDMPDWNTVATVYTNDVGRWRVAGLAHGEYVVSASMPDSLIRFTGFLMPKQLASGTGSAAQLTMFYGGGFGVASAKRFTVNPPEHLVIEPLVIRPKTFHSVTAAIRSKDFDRPVNAGYAFINSKTTGFNAIAQINRTGVAQFDYVPAGDYTLTVRASDEVPSSQHDDAESPFPPPFPEPIRNYFETSAPATIADHDVTLPVITTAVQWQKPGTTRATDEKLVQAATGGEEIAIHVTIGLRTPARFSRVHLEPVPDLSPGAPRRRDFAAIAGLDGTVRFEHVPAGDYVLFAELGGFLSPLYDLPKVQGFTFSATDRARLLQVLQHVQVSENSQPKPEEITLKLQPGTVLTGRVSFDDGAAAAGLPVDALSKPGEELQRIGLDLGQNGGDRQNAVTDDQGIYRIAGLPVGSYSMRVLVPSGGINGSNNFEPSVLLHSGQYIAETVPQVATNEARPTEVNHAIPLSTWKTVTGRITVASGPTPLNHAEVELTPQPCCSGASRRLAIIGDGSFAIKNVPPGTYSLKARGWQPIPGRAGSPRTQTLEFLQTLTVAPNGKPPNVVIPLAIPTTGQPAR